ncbi:TATA-binding protein-associated factor 172-like, partial [Amphibalanus amphitrite]|uniref:TATA-binding protein-associated factor 172-like n=1 Tax=Amphibalanus amphitrite TaxID=1232801 RepID=UPI001C924CFE
DTFSVVARQGAIETVWCLVDALWMDVLPYLVLLVVPVLGRMSDRDLPVRLLASRTFASIIQLMPLEPGCPGGDAVPSPLNQQKVAERCFLDQLMDPSCIEDVPVPAGVRAQLRPYQRRGVSWLAFLNKYHLHGVLCDDMGLGKSLQSLCMIVADHAARREQFERSGATEDAPRPSLIVCPPTLTGHWMYEVDKFVEPSELRPLHYFGLPAERSRLQVRLPNHNLVISSYDIVRNDIDFFVNVKWNYCVLDEGHIIKNGKTKVAKAIKQLDSRRRLILTGTPLQNSVLELWSLFDFLMPGFLGTERQFTTRYSRPILLSRDAKANSREQEAGALAMEALHRQVLPFLLRRLKEDVLEDLPPKITQDYYCELSDIQKQLYEDFARSRAQRSLVEGLESVENRRGVERAPPHVFQALQYLRKVCNHPKLVLTKQHPSYAQVQKTLCEQGSSLEQIDHSAKLVALKQLLLDLGIGEEDGMPTASSEVVHPHRVLIFCQLRSMLDMVEHDLLQGHLSGVTYLRLDGSVPAGERHALVHRFNSDPSIDCLLLTTQVGGLGLNLVGADTVIFVEHDWNPMKDLQAMDRAHRIGQRRVVNVYRLITRGTLEEKIMGLQKFKLLTANTVITAENSSLLTMGTDQVGQMGPDWGKGEGGSDGDEPRM